jgi:YidC/Oxa1 family membrane protein insertase
MDNQRFILFIGLTSLLFFIWSTWQQDYPPQPTTASVVESGAPEIAAPKDVPVAQKTGEAAELQRDAPETPKVESETLASSQRVHVVTANLDLIIDTRCGDLRQVDLRSYPVALDKLDTFFRLMKDSLPNLFIAQTGLLSEASAPDHYALFKAEKTEYELAYGQDELRIPLVWQSDDGIKVVKTFIFKSGTHTIDVEQYIENNSNTQWKGRQYRQLQRTRPDGSGESAFIYTYTGGVLYSEKEKYEKIKFDDMAEKDLARDIENGWAAIIQHYFLGAIIPIKGETNRYYSKSLDADRFILGLASPSKTIEVGQADTFVTRFYTGPKEQAVLSNLAEGLDLTVDYGILTIFSKPLFVALGWFHSLFGNWGWAIIMVTFIVKLLFYPLSAASYRSMANMRRFAPKIQQLKERYGDDRQKMSQAMMDLYKKEKINPLGGCLPMIVQIPVFIALYWVLLESVELRQAPFVLWITDLSIRDPYYILPLLMGVSMFIQQKLNPAPPDPMQAKIMMALPVVFTVFFAFFPAGLVLYWTANSILSITQHWYITHKIEKAAAASK